ncbi:MAG: hypothetical protein C4524_10340 [Candidatus Zixiibacteriota bacterium]|nr:MAG: hypothetical protein C4524_10340 [candidate division Zixibacteria bacterium]
MTARRLRLAAGLILALALFLALFHDAGSWTFLGFGDSDPGLQALLDEGRTLRDRRLFEPAEAAFNRVLEADPLNEEATWELAETCRLSRRPAEALDWYWALRIMAPQRREVFARYWQCAVQLAGTDTILVRAARAAVRREIAEFLEDYPWDWETLDAALEGAQAIEDSLLSEELTSRLIANHPDTPAGYRLLSDRFYEGLYPLWNDASARAAYIRDFLGEHRASPLRETAWTYLAHALNEAGDTLNLRLTLFNWMAEEPDNPVPYERCVHYLLDKGAGPDSLLPVARKAVELARGWRGNPLKHVEQRVMESKQLYAGTRLNAARVLMALNRLAEARLWLEDGLRHSGFGVDDDGTTAPFHYLLGVVAEREGRPEEAFDRYVQALIEGDVRSVWSARADSALARLHGESFAAAPDQRTRARQRQGYDGPVFDDLTDSLGLAGVAAMRIAWGDADGDGWEDLLLNGSRLFLNWEGTRFIEVTDSCGLSGEGVSGGVWADADLDGDLDLFCAAGGQGEAGDRLYLNHGHNRSGLPQFRVAADLAAVLSDSFPTEGAAWGDLQGDGRPDLYAANYELPGSELGRGTPDFLYLNLPDPGAPSGLRFVKLGPDSGLAPPFGENLCGRGVQWGDFDGDGDQDVYVSNYRLQENFLWENLGGKALSNQACFHGLAGKERDGWRGHTIGSQWGDFDNDGDLDLICANLAHPRYIEISERTVLYENRLRQEGGFTDVRRDWGIKYEETHSDPAWGDVDGDGDLDLYLTSIYPGRRSFLYLNELPRRRFRDVTWLAGVRMTNAWGCAFCDFDRDGDLDLAVGSSQGVRVYRNRGGDHHWLEVELQIPGGGYGTRLVLRRGRDLQVREIQGGKGTTSQESAVAYFGLGNSAEPVSLELRLPSGEKRRLKKISPDQRLILRGPDFPLAQIPGGKPPPDRAKITRP